LNSDQASKTRDQEGKDTESHDKKLKNILPVHLAMRGEN